MRKQGPNNFSNSNQTTNNEFIQPVIPKKRKQTGIQLTTNLTEALSLTDDSSKEAWSPGTTPRMHLCLFLLVFPLIDSIQVY